MERRSGGGLFAGIDGGQSSTVALIADAHGKILARASGGPSDDVGQGRGSTRRRDTFEKLLHEALERAGYPESTPFDTIVAGISGYEGPDGAEPLRVSAERVRLLHDAPVAHAGALAGQPGIIAIAGTGSVVYGDDLAGNVLTLGGRGYLFGDEGSAFWLARCALADAMRAQDEGGETALGVAAPAFFDVPSLRGVARGFAQGSISRAQLASFSMLVLNALRLGDAQASSLVDEGLARLAESVAAAAKRLALRAPQVAGVGGLFAAGEMRARFAAAVAHVLPEAGVKEPVYEPAAGALILAYREAGHEITTLE